MTNHTREFLNIIKSAITGAVTDASESFLSDGSFLQLVKKHHISTMFYYGLRNCGLLSDKLKNSLYDTVLAETMLSEQQLLMFEEVTRAFAENGVDYMPLKGCHLKKLYSKPEIRRMGDIDILIKMEQYDTIEKLMQKCGFENVHSSDHDFGWARDGVLIEIHKSLMPPYDNKDFHAYFGDGWERAHRVETSGFAYSAEDTFIYLFAHFAKHYREAGIGIIHMCDLYLFLNAYALDLNYVKKELEKLRLYDFYRNIVHTLQVWFADGDFDKMAEHITEVIFNSGVYGLVENTFMSTAVKNKTRGGNYIKGQMLFVLNSFFPEYQIMRKRYQILAKMPFLLPCFWIWRLIVIFTTKRKNIQAKMTELHMVSEKKTKTYEDKMKFVGLTYNFK